jgi:purine catabolism regulator
MRIKDALKFGGLSNAEMVAGLGGLENLIETVSVLEVTDVSKDVHGSKWMFKNQLYVTAFYAIKDDVKAQCDLIEKIADRGGSGIVLCHLDFWVKRVDQSVIETCNQRNVPLIIVPSDTAYTDIIIPINDRLLKVYSEKYKYSLDIQSKLNELIIANSDINDIGNYVSGISKSGITIFDVNYNTIANSQISEGEINHISSFCKNHFTEIKGNQGLSRIIRREINEKFYYIHPVISGNEYFGLIVLEENSETKIEVEILYEIIKYTGIAIALISTKKQRIEKMQDIYFRDYLGDLLTWNFRDEKLAITRGLSIGWDIRNKRLLVLVNVNSAYEGRDLSKFESTIENEMNEILPSVIELIKEDNPNNIMGYRSDQLIILLEDGHSEYLMFNRAKSLSAKIIEAFKRDFKYTVSIGLSDYYQKVSSVAEAFKEATYAMNIGRSISGEYAICSNSELGFIPYFDKKEFDSISIKMRRHLIEPLIEYDIEHNSDLVMTLRNLLFYNQNFSYISEMMYIHRNTLLARKKKIIEILKLDPFEMPNMVNYLILLTQMSMEK